MFIAPLFAIALATGLTTQTSDVLLNPPEMLPLGGYTARHGAVMTGIGDPLHARVEVLRNGSTRLAIVSAEMLTIPESLAREVRKRIPSDIDLFLAATHTHCAPDSQMLNDRMTLQIPGIAYYHPRWLKWYADRIASGVNDALHAPQQPITSLDLHLSHVDANRPRRLDGDPDQSFWRLTGDNRTLLASYAAHATFFTEKENVTRGDWPGELARRLSCPVIVGAIGDVSPKAPGNTPAERIDNLVDRLIAGRPVQSLPVWSPGDPVRVLSQPIDLGTPVPHPRFAHDYSIPPSLAANLVRAFAPPTASITAFRIGRFAVVGVPGEPSSHLGRAIREYGMTLGFSGVLVVSHVNAWMGYILGPEDYDRGGYEATLNFYGRNEGLSVVTASRKALLNLTHLASR